MPKTSTHRTRRLPTKEQIHVWRAFTETAEIIRSRAGSKLQQAAKLSTADYQVLLALSEAPEKRLRPSELAASIGWDRSRLSHQIGRMEKRGLLQREECLTDNRGAYVVLLTEGAKAFRAGSIPHLEVVRELFFDALTTEHLTQLSELMHVLREHLELPAVPGSDTNYD